MAGDPLRPSADVASASVCVLLFGCRDDAGQAGVEIVDSRSTYLRTPQEYFT